MNKAHNNLNIENLIKTEWFEQFNKEQQTKYYGDSQII